MKKSKKYLVVIKHYTYTKREPDIEPIAICDTEEEALSKCKRKYSDIIEVWAENWPQDKIDYHELLHLRRSENNEYAMNWVEDWMKEHKK